MDRALGWFSCGAASAVAGKITIEKYGEQAEILYCNTFAYEHPDNRRFFWEVQDWYGVEIKILQSEKYRDIFDVFEKTKWLVGVNGARCTTELKKKVRQEYSDIDDIHILGLTVDETARIDRFKNNNPELITDFILQDRGITKNDCYKIIERAGIELPEMYKLGYSNNNCIGCVKGGAGYWNKIKKDFPFHFKRMAILERRLDVAINKRYEGKERKKVFLDELPEGMGNYNNEPSIECNGFCQDDLFTEQELNQKLGY